MNNLLNQTIAHIKSEFVGINLGDYNYKLLKDGDNETFALVMFPDSSVGYAPKNAYLGRVEKEITFKNGTTAKRIFDKFDENKLVKINELTPTYILAAINNKISKEHFSFQEKLKYNTD